ncbi:ATP-binding protein, partial [Escherichia coli]|uniref:ATP-binding protein n=2 Tax=Enterobacteriaceae TaxID=543 RepID=UPI00137A8C5D
CVGQGITRKALADKLDEMAAAAELVQRNLHRAADLISSFKQVAVDRQSSQRRQFQLDQVIHEICLTLRPSLSKAKCQLDVTAAAGLVMDSFPGPLGQVLTNLVQNALLHGFEGRADARIWVEAQGLDAGHVQIVVRDNGVGVLPEHQGRVFDPFFTTRMGRGGTGLGLHICFNITTAVLGGK